MAKRKPKIPTTDEVERLLSTPKGLVQRMSWMKRDPAKDPPMYRWYSAVDLETGVIIEDVRVLSQWRQPLHSWQIPYYQFGIYISDKHRVFAHDYEPGVRHKNHKGYGEGLPYYEQIISTPHAHIWTKKGYNYAEPLPEEVIVGTMEQQWAYFCSKANIIRNISFSDPIFEAESGQGSLL